MTSPTGWYPDPYDESQLRYWDGGEWTDATTPVAGTPADPSTAATTDGTAEQAGSPDAAPGVAERAGVAETVPPGSAERLGPDETVPPGAADVGRDQATAESVDEVGRDHGTAESRQAETMVPRTIAPPAQAPPAERKFLPPPPDTDTDADIDAGGFAPPGAPPPEPAADVAADAGGFAPPGESPPEPPADVAADAGGFAPPGARPPEPPADAAAESGGFVPPEPPPDAPAIGGGVVAPSAPGVDPGDSTQVAAPPVGADPAAAGGFGEIGDWISATFSRVFERIGPMFLLTFLVPVLAIVAMAVLSRSLLAGITLSAPDATGLRELQGFSGGSFGALTGVAFLALVLGSIFWLGANHQMYAAHVGQPQSVGASIKTGLRRLPRAILWLIPLTILLTVLYLILVAAIVAIIAALGPEASGDPVPILMVVVLGVVGLLALVVLVWLGVKLAFWGMAISVGPKGTNPFSASFGVSRGAFFGALGRLLLLTLVVGLVRGVFNIAFQILFGAKAATLFQVNAVTGDVFINGQLVDDQDVITFADFVPGTGWFALAGLLWALGFATSQALNISGIAGLYSRRGGPGEV